MLPNLTGATELAQLFKNLGRPLGIDRVAETFMKYDKDESGQIEFGEFLLMFRDSLLELDKIKAFTSGEGLGAGAGGVLEVRGRVERGREGGGGEGDAAVAAQEQGRCWWWGLRIVGKVGVDDQLLKAIRPRPSPASGQGLGPGSEV